MTRKACATVWTGLALLGSAGALPAQEATSRAALFPQLPDWSGIWVSAEPVGRIDIDGYPELNPYTDWPILGFTAPYNEAAQIRLEEFANDFPLVPKANSWGYPMMMQAPTPLQFLITPEETVILNFYRDVRHIYTDGRALPAEADRWPVAWGESIGRWEDDTLVITTVSVARPGLDGGPLPLITEQAVYEERISMAAPERLELEMTVTDPATLREPWALRLAFKRVSDIDRMFHMLFDYDRTGTAEDGTFTISPEPQL